MYPLRKNQLARLENGVLDILLPKEEKAQPRKISISAGSQTPQLEN